MWQLGESRYIYTRITASDSSSFTISNATCTVYDDEGTQVVSTTANIDNTNHVVSYLFTPSEIGIFVAVFSYVINSQTFKSSQVIEVTETIG